MIQKNSENARVLRHLLNVGPLTAPEACQCFVSNNLRSRVSELSKMGFDIVSMPVDGKQYNRYLIPPHLLEKNRELFGRHMNG